MLRFQPKPGSIVFCDFSGFIEPEMVKKRPVIVVSKHKRNSKLLSVVPISTTHPGILADYHIELDRQFRQIHLSGKQSWIKCDMINVVCLERLHLLKDKLSGLRHAPNVGEDVLRKVKEAIKSAHSL